MGRFYSKNNTVRNSTFVMGKTVSLNRCRYLSYRVICITAEVPFDALLSTPRLADIFTKGTRQVEHL